MDPNKFLGVLKSEIIRNLKTAGLYLVGKTRAKLNTDQPYTRYKGINGVYYKGLSPSLPGQYPKKLSGQLLKSITYKVNSDEMALVVGSALPYAMYLQVGTRKMSPRPWLTKIWREEGQNVVKLILG
jgi:phage gpG-like protein